MTYLKELYQMIYEDSRRKYPDVPLHAIPSTTYKVKTSNGLTRAIIKWIQLKGGQAERISVTGRMIDERKTYKDVLGYTRQVGSIRWIHPSMQRGTADISAIISGRSVKIEIKIGKDKQHEDQKRYQQQVEDAGGVYIIVSDFEDFCQWWYEFTGAIKNN